MDIHVGKRMRTALIAQQQGVALAIVAGIVRFLGNAHQTAVRVFAPSGGDTLADDSAAGILSEMNHLCTGICLLVIIGYRHAVKLCRGVIARKDTGRIFPGNGRTGFHLRPGQFAIYPFAVSAFRYEIIHAAFAFGITRIPVLDSAVLHFRTVVHHNLHNGGMQLVFVTHRRRTSLQVRNV